MHLLISIHIVGEWISGLHAGLDPSVKQRIIRFASGYVQRTLATPISVFAQFVSLRLFEVRQTLGITPT